MQDFLDWDDEESPTKETPVSLSRSWPSKSSHRRPLRPIRLASRDEPSIEVAPATEIELHEPFDSSPGCGWDSDEATHPDALAPTAAPSALPVTTRSEAPPPASSLPEALADALRAAPARAGVTLVSEASPPDEADFDDRRTTARRPLAPLPWPPPSLEPASLAVPLLRPLPPKPVRGTGSSFPPVALSAPRPEADLLQEVLRLRRWVKLTGTIAVAALAGCAVLCALLARSHERPALAARAAAGLSAVELAPSRQGLVARSELAGVRIHVDGRDRGALPVELTDLEPGSHELRFVGPPGYQPLDQTIEVEPGEMLDLGIVALEPRGIELTLTVMSVGTTVSIAKQGTEAEIVPGPFPRKLHLEPGTYALFAARGTESYARPIYVTRERGPQEIVIP